jgi:dCTP deaminase
MANNGGKSRGGIPSWHRITSEWDEAGQFNADGIVVTPMDAKGLDTDSLGLRLGPRFVLSRPHAVAWMDFGGALRKEKRLEVLRSQELVHIPKDKSIVIPPHGTILGVTLEFIKLPYNVAGQVLTKSSLARRFITVETAPWIHPLYRGCLTLEIANASAAAVRLVVGTAIAQLVLFSVADVKPRKKDRIDRYAGPTYPELDPVGGF